jgi:hypothetical protein
MPLNIVARTSVPWMLRLLGTAQTVGTAGLFTWTGYWLSEAFVNTALQSSAAGPGPGGTMVPWTGTATGGTITGATWDMTVSQITDLNFTQSVTTGSCQLRQYNLSVLTATGF